MPEPYRKKSVVASQVCKFFQRGKCYNKRCPYLHVMPDSRASIEVKGSEAILTAMLKLFFEKQQHCLFNKETGIFNLSDLASYSELATIGSSLNFNSTFFCSTLCGCIRDTIIPPPSVYQFDNNNIKSVFPLADAFRQNHLCEDVRALSFANNGIKVLNFVEHLKFFSRLQEVVFTNNPVALLPDYRNKLKKEIVSLFSIDGSPARALPLALPWPKFYASCTEKHNSVATNSRSLVYTALEENLIQFILSRIIEPLEKSGGVDAVSDSYSRSAVFSISFDADASISSSTVGSTALQRNVVRDIVAFRLRQKETNHNLLLGGKSQLIALGRTQVCTTLQDVLYPKNFSVSQWIHPSIDVTVLDNVGENPGMALLRESFSLIVLHGVISWTHQPSSLSCVIRRSFTRVFTVVMGERGGWEVTNDTVFLRAYHFDDSSDPLFTGVLYTPWKDISFARRLAVFFDVPEPVVVSLINCPEGYIDSEAQLATILGDLSSIPLSQYECNASLLNGSPLASIMLCRLQKVFELQDAQLGIRLIQECGLDWESLKTGVLSVRGGQNV